MVVVDRVPGWIGCAVAILAIGRFRPQWLVRRSSVGSDRLDAIRRGLDQSERAEVERLLRSRRKIDAIRFVPQRTGASLVEAKALVESPVEGSDGL